MPSLTTLLRSLGNDGAVANVEVVLDERRRQDWLVAGLTRRIAACDRARGEAATPAQPGTAAA